MGLATKKIAAATQTEAHNPVSMIVVALLTSADIATCRLQFDKSDFGDL
jgi:hypothetical protein